MNSKEKIKGKINSFTDERLSDDFIGNIIRLINLSGEYKTKKEIETLLKEREKKAIEGFVEWFDERYLHPEGQDCSGVVKYYLRNLQSNNLEGNYEHKQNN